MDDKDGKGLCGLTSQWGGSYMNWEGPLCTGLDVCSTAGVRD